jgi:hypothetical protein
LRILHKGLKVSESYATFQAEVNSKPLELTKGGKGINREFNAAKEVERSRRADEIDKSNEEKYDETVKEVLSEPEDARFKESEIFATDFL